MAERAGECPFAERVDHRCSSFFRLERLDHTFQHCFGAYKACPLYHELMAERVLRKALAGESAKRVAESDPAARGTMEPLPPRTAVWVSPRLKRPQVPAPYAPPCTQPPVRLTIARTHASLTD